MPVLSAFSYRDLRPTEKNYIETGKVCFISLDLPLDFHPFSVKAAEASRCASDQGKYWEMRDALITNSATLSDDLISKLAETTVIKMDEFQSCISSHRHKVEIQKDATEAAALQIGGTPTFVLAKSSKDKLDGVKLVGALQYAQLRRDSGGACRLNAPERRKLRRAVSCCAHAPDVISGVGHAAL